MPQRHPGSWDCRRIRAQSCVCSCICCSSQIIGISSGTALLLPAWGCLWYPSHTCSFPSLLGRASPPVLPHTMGPGCAGREFRDLLAPGFGIFPSFLKTFVFLTFVLLEDWTRFKPRCSFSLLQTLFPALPSLCWKLKPRCSPRRGCIQWISLGFSSGTTAALTSSLHEGPASVSSFPPGAFQGIQI